MYCYVLRHISRNDQSRMVRYIVTVIRTCGAMVIVCVLTLLHSFTLFYFRRMHMLIVVFDYMSLARGSDITILSRARDVPSL